MSQGHAIMTRSTPNAVVINNTVWDVDHGIAHDNPYAVEFINNIVGNVASSGHHLGWANSSSGNLSTVRNMLLSGSVKIDYGTNDYTSLESFQSATGKGQGSRTGDPRFLPGSLLINSDSPAVNAGYATANGGPHPVFALFESTYPGHGSIARDSRGTNRPSAGAMWDIGASEYGDPQRASRRLHRPTSGLSDEYSEVGCSAMAGAPTSAHSPARLVGHWVNRRKQSRLKSFAAWGVGICRTLPLLFSLTESLVSPPVPTTRDQPCRTPPAPGTW